MNINTSQVYFLSFIISGVSTFFATSIYSRLLTTFEFGLYALGLSIFTIMNSLLFQWNKLSLLRNIDGENNVKVLSNSIMIYFSLVLVSLFIFTVVDFFDIYQSLNIYVFFYLISFSLFDFFVSYLRASLKPIKFLVLNLLKSTLSILIAYLALNHFSPSSNNLFLSISFSLLLSFLIVFFKDFAFLFSLPSHFNFIEIKKQIKFGVPLTASIFCSNSIYSLSRIIGGSIISISVIGIFSAYFTVIQQIIFTLAMACNSYGYTKLVRDHKIGLEKSIITLQRNLIMIINFILPAFIFVFSNSELFFGLYFPSEYHGFDRDLIFLIFITVIVFSLKTYYFEHLYHLEYKTDFLFRCSFFSLILFLSVIYPLTNYYDELGLIVSILISYSYNCVLLWVNCKKITGIRIKTNKHTLLYFIVSILSVIIFEFLNFSNEYYKLYVSVLVVTTLHSWGWYLYLKRIK